MDGARIFGRVSPKQLFGVPDKARAFIESQQPYRWEDTDGYRYHWLWVLHDLNRIDKHRNSRRQPPHSIFSTYQPREASIAGVSLDRIGDYAGHSGSGITNRYRHLRDGRQAEDAARVNAYLDGLAHPLAHAEAEEAR